MQRIWGEEVCALEKHTWLERSRLACVFTYQSLRIMRGQGEVILSLWPGHPAAYSYDKFDSMYPNASSHH
jgi:hypothetical protein